MTGGPARFLAVTSLACDVYDNRGVSLDSHRGQATVIDISDTQRQEQDHEEAMDAIRRRLSNLVFRFTVTGQYTGSPKNPFHLDYESGTYRQDDLADLVRDAIPHFALTRAEYSDLVAQNRTSDLHRRAWRNISTAPKNQKGDFGELLLYLFLMQFFDAPRFVVKARLRTAPGDPVKGFDCAHFTVEAGKVCLWLGEAKFYSDFSKALSRALESITDHSSVGYLKSELAILGSNIEQTLSPADIDLLSGILNDGVSLDRVTFRVPVLLTYDSIGISKCCALDEEFRATMEKEFAARFGSIEAALKHPSYQPHGNFELIFLLLPFRSVKDMKARLETIERAYRI